MTDEKILDLEADNVAALEKRAREKLLAEEEPEKVNFKPVVGQVKKRKKGKAIFITAISGILLIVLAWTGNYVYRNFFWKPAEDKLKNTDEKNGTDYRLRHDLGKNNDSNNDTAPSEPVEADDSQPVSQLTATPPAVLNKALFLERKSDTAATQTVKTRRDEMRLVTAAETGTDSTGNAAEAAAQIQRTASAVRRVPYDPDLYIPENTAIPCSLDYRFISERSGKIRCTLTDDVWSASGNTRLIEKGTVATGVYQAGDIKNGQGRVFIIITKLRTMQPPFLDIPLTDTAAAGELGEAGIDGWVNEHFWKRFGAALMVGMIPDLANLATNSAGKKDRNTDYTENSRQAMAEMAKTVLEKNIDIPPTLYKNQGELISLITGQDIDFSEIYHLEMKK